MHTKILSKASNFFSKRLLSVQTQLKIEFQLPGTSPTKVLWIMPENIIQMCKHDQTDNTTKSLSKIVNSSSKAFLIWQYGSFMVTVKSTSPWWGAMKC